MRDKERMSRSALALRVRELEQASKEFVELLGAWPENSPIFATLAANPEIGAAWQRCREKLRNKSAASKAWQESLTKGSW